VSDAITLDFGPEIIAALLPHREPIILVDHVLRYVPHPRATLEASLTIRGDEPVLRGHFPGRPIWPGAYLMEGVAQCAGLLLNLRAMHQQLGGAGLGGESDFGGRGPEKTLASLRGSVMQPVIGLLARARIDMFEPVVPPATLRYCVRYMGEFGPLARIDGEVEVDGRRVAAGSVSVTLGLPPDV
jgi:3-hydroxyacyl-[acyl-carrier-protein] dehydratase